MLWGLQPPWRPKTGFLVKCCLLAAALLPDTFPALWRPLSLTGDLGADATAPRGGGELRSPCERPLPWLRAGAAPLPLPYGALQFRVPTEFQLTSRDRRRGCQGLGPSPGPPSGHQREQDWEGGKRKLSVPGAEDASKGISCQFQAAQLCLSEERAGERVAGPLGSRTLTPFVYTPPPGLPGARGGAGAAPPGGRKEGKGRRGGWAPGPPRQAQVWPPQPDLDFGGDRALKRVKEGGQWLGRDLGRRGLRAADSE